MKDLLISPYFWKTIYTLGGIGVLLLISMRIIKFWHERPSQKIKGSLTCSYGLALDPKRHLIVVRWQQKEYLLLITPSGEQVIDQRLVAEANTPLAFSTRNEPTPPTFSQPYELTGQHAVS